MENLLHDSNIADSNNSFAYPLLDAKRGNLSIGKFEREIPIRIFGPYNAEGTQASH